MRLSNHRLQLTILSGTAAAEHPPRQPAIAAEANVIPTLGITMRDPTDLMEAFNKLRKAMLNNDEEKLKLWIAEEYVGFDPSGNLQDNNMSLEAYKPGAVKLDAYEIEDLRARVIGEVGIIIGKAYIHGTFAEGEFEHYLRFLDLYISREGRWQLYLSPVTPIGAV